jgi:hypothetical protein
MDKWLIERFVVFRDGTKVVMPECVSDSKQGAEAYVAKLLEQESAFVSCQLMVIENGSATDTGVSAVDYLGRVLGVVDIGYQVVPIPTGSLILL